MSSRIFIIALCGLFAPCLSFEVYDSCSLARFEHLTESSLMVAYSKCKLKLATKLSEAVSCLSPEAKENAELISKKVINEMREKRRGFYNNRTKDVPLYMAKTGLFDLIEQRIKSLDEYGLFVESSKRREHLKDKVESFIEASCRESYDSLKPMIDIFDLLGQSVTSTDQIDDTTREWLTRGRLCQTVLMETEKIRDPAFEYAYKRLTSEKKELAGKMKEEFDGLISKLLTRHDRPNVDLYEILIDLERSAEIGSELENFNLLNEDEKDKLIETKLLVELADIKEDHCNSRIFSAFRNLKAFEKYHKGTINNYLRHFGSKQYEVCKEMIGENLKKAIDGLTDKQILDIEQLADRIAADHKYDRFASLPFQMYSSGILSFLEPKYDTRIDERTPRFEVEQRVDQLIEEVCDDILKKLEEPICVYRALMYDFTMKYQFDEQVNGWIIKYRICRTLSEDKTKIIESMQKELSKGMEKKKKKRKKKFFGLL